LIEEEGMGLDEALAMLKRVRPCVRPHPSYLEKLRAFEIRRRFLLALPMHLRRKVLDFVDDRDVKAIRCTCKKCHSII
jgi:hypothetical protein